MCTVYGPQITLFSNFFIKNGSHNTIYTFKNYFATVFSVSAKISSIQTHPFFAILANRDRQLQWFSEILLDSPSATFVLHRSYSNC